MSDDKPTSSFSTDVPSWYETVVRFVKDNRAHCLDLRTVPGEEPRIHSNHNRRSKVGVDIRPILDSLVGSSVAELNLETLSIFYNVQDVSDILAKTKITKLCLYPRNLETEDLLYLMRTLEGTQVTDLILRGTNALLEKDQLDQFVTHLVKSQLKSLQLFNVYMQPLDGVSAFFQRLPSTQLTSLNLTNALRSLINFEAFPVLLQILMSSLQHTSITNLTLSENDLVDSSARIIGDGLNNSKLKKLDLSNNYLTSVSVGFLRPGLISSQITHLNLNCNRIVKTFDLLGHFLKDTKITELNLASDPFGGGEDLSLRALLSRLDSEDNTSDNTDKLVPIQVQGLEGSELICLDLSANELELQNISALADFLSTSKVTHIDLSLNKLSHKGLGMLGECIRTSKLKYINLDSNSSSWFEFDSPPGAREWQMSVVSFLDKTKGSSLVSLNLMNTGLYVLPLANTTFCELDLSRNRSLDVTSLAGQLKSCAITALYLNFVAIKDIDAAVLAQCLEDSQIVKLYLKDNMITSVGAKDFAAVLRKTKLRHLDLESNRIQDDGLKSLAEHAENSCLTYLNVSCNPGKRKLLVDRVLWENRRKILLFADLLKRTALFTGDSSMFEFDRDFESTNIDAFIEDCLKLYKMVLKEPFILGAIEQDKHISILKKSKWCRFNSQHSEITDDVFIENSDVIYQKIIEQPSPFQSKFEQKERDASFFKTQVQWLMQEYFPAKFVSFVGGRLEAEVEEHVALLQKIENFELPRLVELLLLNRPLYVIDREQEILHPYVYKLLDKYKQPICNTDIEPEGVDKIIEFFKKNIGLKYASEVICLLNIKKLQQK